MDINVPVPKIDIETGTQVNSTNMTNYYTKDEVDDLLVDKVTVEDGKGLSTNDYTDEDKQLVNEVQDAVESINDKVNRSELPRKLSDLTDDLGTNPIHTHSQYLTSFTETDPVFTASAAHGISSNDITNWNGKMDFTSLSSNTRILDLDKGAYETTSQLFIYYYGTTDTTDHRLRVPQGTLIIVGGTSTRKDFIVIANDSYVGYNSTSGGEVNKIIDASSIANNLTTIASGKVLDASQGAALKDQADANSANIISNNGKIGTLANLTTATQTDLVSAINEVNGILISVDDIMAITSPSDTLFIQLTDLIMYNKNFYVHDSNGTNNYYKVIYSSEMLGLYDEDLFIVYSDGYSFHNISLLTGPNHTVYVTDTINSTKDASINGTTVSDIKTNTAYDSTNNKIATMADIPSVSAPSAMTIGISADTSLSGAQYANVLVPLNLVMSSTGTKLTHDTTNKGIKIGAGVSKIKVSGLITKTGTANTTGVQIYKNNSFVYTSYTIPRGTGLNQTCIPMGIMDVQENDVITLRMYFGANATESVKSYSGGATYLTVEVVE